jgi:phage shock protein C
MAEEKAQSEAQQSGAGTRPPKRLYRATRDKMLCGVCGGVADYFGLDVNIVRVVWAASVLIGGVGLMAYLLVCVIVPKHPNPDTEKAPEKAANPNLLWGLVLILAGAFFLMERWNWWGFDGPFHLHWRWFPFGHLGFLFPIALIIVGIYYIFRVYGKDNNATPATTQPESGGQSMQKRLTRSTAEKMIGGVCGGLAEYFNIDPSFVRIGFALLTLATGLFFGVAAYIIMMFVVPEAQASSSAPVTEASGESQKS